MNLIIAKLSNTLQGTATLHTIYEKEIWKNVLCIELFP